MSSRDCSTKDGLRFGALAFSLRGGARFAGFVRGGVRFAGESSAFIWFPRGYVVVAGGPFFHCRIFGKWLKQEKNSSQGFYPGALLSGLGYYLNRDRWKAVQSDYVLSGGDVLLIPLQTLPRRFVPKFESANPLAQFSYNSRCPPFTSAATDSRPGHGY